jgi:hypothetical protein
MEAERMNASGERARLQIGNKQTEAEQQRMTMEKARQDREAEMQRQAEIQGHMSQDSDKLAHLQGKWPTLESTLSWLKENMSEERSPTKSTYSPVDFGGCTLMYEERNKPNQILAEYRVMQHRVSLSGVTRIEDGGAGLVLIQQQGLHYLYFKDKSQEAIDALKLAARFCRGQG